MNNDDNNLEVQKKLRLLKEKAEPLIHATAASSKAAYVGVFPSRGRQGFFFFHHDSNRGNILQHDV